MTDFTDPLEAQNWKRDNDPNNPLNHEPETCAECDAELEPGTLHKCRDYSTNEDENGCTIPDRPMTCADCGRPTYYDYADEDYHHAIAAADGCFLIRADKDRIDDLDHPLLSDRDLVDAAFAAHEASKRQSAEELISDIQETNPRSAR